ncbi:Lon protease family protein [Marinobacter sp.]|uniref:Lon protease family protein n=1 Tax=Marinobacter sp. TaxID=50741 RepID=UPI00384BE141
MSEARSLKPEDLYSRCDTGKFSFKTTDELDDVEDVVGQERATEAIRFGIGIRRGGYNLYVLGERGTGRRALIGRRLRDKATDEATPPDAVYLNNFIDGRKPAALTLPAGKGVKLQDDMKRLVEDLEAALPATFESEDYRARRKELEDKLQEEQGQPLEELKNKAQKEGLALVRTAQGMAFAPVREDGEIMPREEFNELPEKERDKVQERISELESDLEKILYQVPHWQRQSQRKIRELDREFTRITVDNLMEDLRKAWEDHGKVLDYFDAVRADVIDNVKDFVENEDSKKQHMPPGLMQQEERPLDRYRVNVLVDNSKAEGAPIVFEDHPRYQNLFGSIEHTSRMGTLFTDFTLIKGGALHRANGGYLVVEARHLLTQPLAWEGLKRALFSESLKVEPPGRELLMISTVSLEPEAIDLDVKVVLLGSRRIYQLLNRLDPEFGQLFKVAADFEDTMPRDEDSQELYARTIATIARKKGLMPLDRGATARVIEQGAREAEDAERLSIHTESITDLLREADFWAQERHQDVIQREDVQKSVDARKYRAGRVPEKIREEIRRGTLLIDTEGQRVGQINSLATSDAGQMSFGHPCRVTARVRLGKGEVKDIQREAKLAGRIYSKAVMTLSGYLGAHYAPDFPLMLGASLVFEQTYGGIEGDSATAAELFALLSALADVPLQQSLAVTGSANQYGEVQAIGGVNEKIEGFFATCREKKLTGEQGVLIPASNVKHLMLREEVIEAVRDGKFGIYPFSTIDEGLAIMTGQTSGERDEKNRFPEGTVNYRVQQRLMEMARQTRQWSKGEDGGSQSQAE